MNEATIYISGVIGTDTTLVDVIRQYKSFENIEKLNVVIHSEGGDVDEGNAIYDYLNSLKSEIEVTTITDKAYSISAKIFTVGNNRIVEDVEKAILIHFAWSKVEGTAEELEIVAKYLRELEKDFVAFYSDFLNIDEDTITTLLYNETFISGIEAIDFNFATEIKTKTKAVALINNLTHEKMTTKTQDKSKIQNLINAMAVFFGLDPEKIEAKAELKLQDSNGSDIVFPDLEDSDIPKVGDKAIVDDTAIPDGSYIMPSLEDETLVFVDGAITEIIPKEEEEEEDTNAQGLHANAEEIDQISVWSVNVSNTSFELGEKVTYDYDGETYPVGAGEFKLADGTKIVTDASGVIVATGEQTSVSADAQLKAEIKKLKETSSSAQASLKAKEIEISQLKSKITSKNLEIEKQQSESSKEKANYQASVLLKRKKTN